MNSADDYALRIASLNGHLDVVKCLISHGSNIHTNNDEALRWASKNGHLAVVEYFIMNGADIHAADDYALVEASENGHTAIVKYLEDYIENKKKRSKEIEELQAMLLVVQTKLNELIQQ